MINEVAYSPDIVWVSYGADKYDPAKFRPLNLTDPFTISTNKPLGGVWACPDNSEWGWRDWCRAEDFNVGTLDNAYYFKLKPDAKIYVIDSFKDLLKISTRRVPYFSLECYGIDFQKLVDEGYDGLYVTDKAVMTCRWDQKVNGAIIQSLYSWDVESICVFNPDVIIPIENETVSMEPEELKEIVSEGVRRVLKELNDQFNIKGVYHVSGHNFDQFEKKNFDCFFFSDKPIDINGSKVIYVCNLSMHKPFVFTEGTSWSYPLWLFLSDRDGGLIPEEEFTPEKYDGYLGCPYEFWKMVYYDDDEYSMDEIPMLVQALNMGYDGIIIKSIQEGNTGLDVDDYIVFDPSQIQIVNKTIRKTPDNYLE